jgi:hypothetical protein
LLGNGAATILIISFAWQTWTMRRAIAYPGQQGEIEPFSLLGWLGNRIVSLLQKKKAVEPAGKPEAETEITEQETPPTTKSEESTGTEIESPEEETSSKPEDEATISPEKPILTEESISEEAGAANQEAPLPTTPAAKARETAASKTEPKKGFSLKNLFALGKNKAKTKPAQLAEISDKSESEDLAADWDTAGEVKDTGTSVSSEPVEGAPQSEAELKDTASEVAEGGEIETPEPEAQESPAGEPEAEITSPSIEDVEQTDSLEIEAFVPEDEVEKVIESYRPDLSQPESELESPAEEESDSLSSQPSDISETNTRPSDLRRETRG